MVTAMKTPEQLKAEAQEIEKLKIELSEMTKKVPASVMRGSYQAAVSWKEAAQKAVRALRTATPRINQLREAHHQLSQYGA